MIMSAGAYGQGLETDRPEFTFQGFGVYELSWSGVAGRTYFVQFSSDLQSWGYAPFLVSGNGTEIDYGIFSQSSMAFFRLVHTDVSTSDPENADFDGDGLGNLFELVNSGTDPFSQDSNGNSILDGAEDSDADGATNQSEEATGTESREKDHPLLNLTVVATS